MRTCFFATYPPRNQLRFQARNLERPFRCLSGIHAALSNTAAGTVTSQHPKNHDSNVEGAYSSFHSFRKESYFASFPPFLK